MHYIDSTIPFYIKDLGIFRLCYSRGREVLEGEELFVDIDGLLPFVM